jgi:hypothetical protein
MTELPFDNCLAHTGAQVLGPAQAYARSISVRIDHLRTCVNTRSFAHASIKKWRTDTDRHRPAIRLCRSDDLGTDMIRPPNGLGRLNRHVTYPASS